MKNPEVLIVGAGPSGLMMAAELTRYGIRCRVIDRLPTSTDKSKALAIQARTLEIFAHLGIIDSFLEQGIRLKAANIVSRHKTLAHISFQHIDSVYPFVLSLEQNKTESILNQYLSSLKVTVERETELLSFIQEAERVSVRLRYNRTGKTEDTHFQWLIACDGPHSLIRKALNLSFQGKTFSHTFALADLHIDWKYAHDELFAFFEPQGIMAAFPLPGDNRYRLIFQRSRENTEFVSEPSIETIQQLLREYVGEGVHARDPVWMSNFHINSRLTSHYREGRVFLVGDAAHIHSPIGGQGMNTGLQDAFNLAWKLSFYLHGTGTHRLLDSYEYERLSVGKHLLKATEMGSYMAMLHHPTIASLRSSVISWLTKYDTTQNMITKAISQTGIRYKKSPIIEEHGQFHGNLRVGMRAPSVMVVRNGHPVSLSSLWKETKLFTVLFFLTNAIDQRILGDLLKALSDKKYLQIVIVGHHLHEKALPSAVLQVTNETGEMIDIYGTKENAIYVIRPDGYISFRQTPISGSDDILRHFYQQLTV